MAAPPSAGHLPGKIEWNASCFRAVKMRLFMFVVALVIPLGDLVLVACDSSSRAEPNGSESDAASVACEVPELARFDETRECFEAPAAVPQVCRRSIAEVPSASLGFACAFDPEGHAWGTILRGDIDLTAAGWRFTDHRSGYAPLPEEMRATSAEVERCDALRCALPCPGVTKPATSLCPDAAR